MNRGWICPRCGAAKSPQVDTCYCTSMWRAQTRPMIKADSCPCNPANGGSGVCGCVNPNEVVHGGSIGITLTSDRTVAL